VAIENDTIMAPLALLDAGLTGTTGIRAYGV
jgi:hypothetical protein